MLNRLSPDYYVLDNISFPKDVQIADCMTAPVTRAHSKENAEWNLKMDHCSQFYTLSDSRSCGYSSTLRTEDQKANFTGRRFSNYSLIGENKLVHEDHTLT